mmetsp:Transcript_24633/g.35348  ORF Transcript_24633/g.35348 Transcript_24633/m.35348 type:complete len:206 (+) Transcript_24633:53-670(+)
MMQWRFAWNFLYLIVCTAYYSKQKAVSPCLTTACMKSNIPGNSFNDPETIQTSQIKRIHQIFGATLISTAVAISADRPVIAAIESNNSNNISVNETRNAALLVQRCLKNVKEMEIAEKNSNVTRIETILQSSDFNFFDQATTLLLQSSLLNNVDKAEMQNIKKYVYLTVRRMKELVRSTHSIQKKPLVSPEEIKTLLKALNTIND